MTTTLQPPYRFVRNGNAYGGTARWDVYSTIDDGYLGYVASATSKRNGTIWMAATPDNARAGHGYRNREAAAIALEEATNAEA
jgi:hypothetical protein